MSKGDSEEQLARDRLWEKLHRKRGPRKKIPPLMEGRKSCKVCRLEKDIREFSAHFLAPDGRRYECRLCGWIERYERQQAWAAKYLYGPASVKAMRLLMGYRKAEKDIVKREQWRLSYEALGFPKIHFGSFKRDDGIRFAPFWWKSVPTSGDIHCDGRTDREGRDLRQAVKRVHTNGNGQRKPKGDVK